jgi:hypothetical protein
MCRTSGNSCIFFGIWNPESTNSVNRYICSQKSETPSYIVQTSCKTRLITMSWFKRNPVTRECWECRNLRHSKIVLSLLTLHNAETLNFGKHRNQNLNNWCMFSKLWKTPTDPHNPKSCGFGPGRSPCQLL